MGLGAIVRPELAGASRAEFAAHKAAIADRLRAAGNRRDDMACDFTLILGMLHRAVTVGDMEAVARSLDAMDLIERATEGGETWLSRH